MNELNDAVNSLKNGMGVLVTDDPDRENEADLIFPAESLTVAQMAQLIRDCSGIVCLCITDPLRKKLNLSMMIADNQSKYGTPFTCSIEAKTGVTTGVSASDRVATVRAALSPERASSKIVSPGHVFPLCAHPGGLSARPGHTEATIALMKLSGLTPVGVLCELMNPDGTMARGAQVTTYAETHRLPIVSIQQILAHEHHSVAALCC